jgi:hypothetical protein
MINNILSTSSYIISSSNKMEQWAIFLIIYICGLVLSSCIYGVIIAELGPLYFIIFLWPLAMVVSPLILLTMPAYLLGLKVNQCVHCSGRCLEAWKRARKILSVGSLLPEEEQHLNTGP